MQREPVGSPKQGLVLWDVLDFQAILREAAEAP